MRLSSISNNVGPFKSFLSTLLYSFPKSGLVRLPGLLHPINVNVDGDGAPFNDRPIIVDPGKGKVDPARYGASPKLSPYAGTIGRGAVEMPGFQNWDLAVQRAIKMPLWKLENQALTLRGEAYNCLTSQTLACQTLTGSVKRIKSAFDDLWWPGI